MNRSEILFLYDIADANPNGDPLDDNKPRLDEETETNIVTDVRLKRTIRDYLEEYKNQGLFVKEVIYEDTYIQDAKLRAEDYLPENYSTECETFQKAKDKMKSKILSECIDVRLFGATIPLELKKPKGTGSITLTGPVQFRMGRSLNKVEIQHIKGTGAFASGKNKSQATFREEYVLPYSLIAFYGVINEKTAKYSEMTENDVDLLLDGMWNGTKNLISRSKFGQIPRILIQIEYKEENYFIGDLDKQIFIEHDLDNDKLIRSVNDYKINLSNILNLFEINKNKIARVNLKFDPNVNFITCDSKTCVEKIKDLGIEVKELDL